MVRSAAQAARLEPCGRTLSLSRLAAKSIALAADFAGRRRRQVRGAAERVGVAIAFQDLFPSDGSLHRIDVEARRQFRVLQLKRRMNHVANENRIVLAAAKSKGNMPGRVTRRWQNTHVVADRKIIANDV